MFKKSIGSFLAVSLITAGAGAAASAAGPSVNASQTQNVAGAAYVSSFSKTLINKSQLNGAQSGSATRAQVQAANTSGPGTAAQSGTTGISVNGGGQTTTANDSTSQSATVSEPSQVIQSQIDHRTAIQFNLSIPGGPTIQHQSTYRTASQYSSVSKLP